ncbi:hypothetical protein [Paenibacillus sp. FSL L8-0709]|uniref:hypothetical protein n=1 Tax=Paenibacillus sp. FSL L8-0709 TaxID=2975312 RepID=UPI0030FA58B1
MKVIHTVINREQETNEVQVYIGARALKDQIGLILPTYDLLLEHIEQMRSVSLPQRQGETNNTIGIFGARGTGKTSAIYTIREELAKNEGINIMLPIIEPDNFGDNTKILGSIVGLLKDVVEQQLEAIKECHNQEDFPDYFNNCILKDRNPLLQKMNELIEYHLYTESEYRTLLIHNYDDLATHIKKSSRLLVPDIHFKQKLGALIHEIVKGQASLYSHTDPVMIFIFIDDIDLKTAKCRELVESILQYANHPNVVTILSGDYETLTESLLQALLKEEGLQHLIDQHPGSKFELNVNEMRESKLELNVKETTRTSVQSSKQISIVERKRELSHEYIKKVIPPARRHQMVNWTIDTIPNFAFGKRTLATQLEELLGEGNIFAYRENDVLNPIRNSYQIFDERPRGLVNVYYYIHQINLLKSEDSFNQLTEEDKQKKLFPVVKSLVDTIITSSTKLALQQHDFLEKCLRWGSGAENTYIDYRHIQGENGLCFLVICDLLKQQLHGIKFDQEHYYNAKQSVLMMLSVDADDRTSLDKMINLTESSSWTYRLYKAVTGIVRNTDLRTSLLLLELLSKSEFKTYYYESYLDEERDAKDRFVFVSINKLLQLSTHSELLKELVHRSHDNQDKMLSETFAFLRDISTTTSEYSSTERIFLRILKRFDKTESNDNEKRQLFVNTFAYIMKQAEKNEPIGKVDLREAYIETRTKYDRQIHFIKGLISDILEGKALDERAIRNMNKIIDALGGALYRQTTGNLNVKLQISKRFISVWNEFHAGYDGQDNNSRYAQTKIAVKKLWENGMVEFYQYIDIYKKIRALANNNKVRFGRQEANKLLAALKQEVRFNTDLFEQGQSQLLYQVGTYIQYASSEVKEDADFERMKEIMKQRLDIAYEEAKKELEHDLEQIGLTLQDEELNEPGDGNDR